MKQCFLNVPGSWISKKRAAAIRLRGDFLVRDGKSGQLCDPKAIVGAAFGYQFPGEGPLYPADFSGGEATVVPKLQRLGFEVVRIGEDWTSDEVQATVASYFEMLRLEAVQQR